MSRSSSHLLVSPNLPPQSASFPLDQYAPIVPNPAPLTDIEIRTCLPLVDCTPPTNPETDSKYGKWVKVDRALDPKSAIGTFATGGLSNLFNSLEQKFIFYRRSRRSDVRKITEIKLVEEGSERPDGNLGWHRVKNDLRTKMMTSMWGKEKPLHLYFKTFGGKEEKEVELDSLGRPIEKVEEVKVEYDSLGRPIFGQGGGYAEKDALTELDIMVSLLGKCEMTRKQFIELFHPFLLTHFPLPTVRSRSSFPRIHLGWSDLTSRTFFGSKRSLTPYQKKSYRSTAEGEIEVQLQRQVQDPSAL